MKPSIIALTGNRGAGKTYLAREIAEYTLEDVEVLPFADGLKAGLAAMFPWLTYEQLYGRHKESFDPGMATTPRRALQTLGTEWARSILGRDTWVRRWLYVYERSTADVVLVDDVRFENEAQVLLELGATFIHVEGGDPPEDHASEGFGPVEGSLIVPPLGGLTHLLAVAPEIVR